MVVVGCDIGEDVWVALCPSRARKLAERGVKYCMMLVCVGLLILVVVDLVRFAEVVVEADLRLLVVVVVDL